MRERVKAASVAEDSRLLINEQFPEIDLLKGRELPT
jgi:hypothetical protein